VKQNLKPFLYVFRSCRRWHFALHASEMAVDIGDIKTEVFCCMLSWHFKYLKIYYAQISYLKIFTIATVSICKYKINMF
jgi:hypothetical protein